MNLTWRRIEARQAFLDATIEVHETPAEGDMLTVLDAARDMLEVATTVKITGDIVEAFGRAWHEADAQGTQVRGARRSAGLRAAFEAAGFEVVE